MKHVPTKQVHAVVDVNVKITKEVRHTSGGHRGGYGGGGYGHGGGGYGGGYSYGGGGHHHGLLHKLKHKLHLLHHG